MLYAGNRLVPRFDAWRSQRNGDWWQVLLSTVWIRKIMGNGSSRKFNPSFEQVDIPHVYRIS